MKNNITIITSVIIILLSSYVLIVIEGIDGSGKSTHGMLLTNELIFIFYIQ